VDMMLARGARSMKQSWLAIMVLACLLIGGPAASAPAAERVEVELRSEPVERLRGELVRWDEAGITVKVDEGEQTIAWFDMTPHGAFRLRQRLVDRRDAAQLFALGEMGRAMGIDRQAQQVIELAVRRDPTLRERADLVLQKTPGWGLQQSDAAPSPHRSPAPGRGGEPPVITYRESTPAEDAAAIEAARARTREVEQK